MGVADLGSRSDADLIAAIADGDRDALHLMYVRHQPWLTTRLRHRCSDPDVVAEAVQDTFVAVWKSADKWTGVGEPTAWIWGIGIRRLIGVLRHRSRWSPVSNHVPETSTLTTAEDAVLFGVAHGDTPPPSINSRSSYEPSCRRPCWTVSPRAKRPACSASRPAPSRPA